VTPAGLPAAAAASRRPAGAPVLALAAVAAALALPPWSPSGSAAWAQGLQHDSTLPIEITADSLEVMQNQQVATFLGNVDAVQGDLVLTSDQLRVHYRGGSDAAGVTAGSIRRIEAMGNVFMSSPEETAQGEFGVYDVDGALLTLEGSVVLTRDENVVRGERLEIDLATGRSQMFAAVPSTAGGTPGQRVKAVFVPPPEPVEPAAGPDGASGDAGSDDGAAAAPATVPPGPSPPKATE
jgi:lipopolysaccharide export system protein LptA